MNPLRWLNAQLAGIAEERRVAQELSYLSARSLADIGLSASDIPSVAREARRTVVARSSAEIPLADPRRAFGTPAA